MIHNDDNIGGIFNVFHDGNIIEYERTGNDLMLKVEISYLTEKVRDGFSCFTVTLFDCTNIQLETWPNQNGHEAEFFHDFKQIFQANLWILEAEIKNKLIVVSCSQVGTTFDYCGGFLSFRTESAKVIDEVGKEYSINELENLSKSYWDEWRNNN
ncbi:MAG: hypothetical protein D3915_14040 [Candidatus Electrothrix sp. AU1_5]|nr:hypothetical protein [Candidatus Electrothrix gigas]